MTFKEKSAWISFVTILLVFGWYFFNAFSLIAVGETHGGRMIHLLLVAMGTFIALEVVLHIAAAVLAPKDANPTTDERERLIALKATRIAFYVLVVGALLAAATLHHGADKFTMANAVLFAVVVAELTKYGSQILFFRRGV